MGVGARCWRGRIAVLSQRRLLRIQQRERRRNPQLQHLKRYSTLPTAIAGQEEEVTMQAPLSEGSTPEAEEAELLGCRPEI